MNLTHLINVVITGALPHVWLVPAAIVLGTFILEDATTMLVGVLAADGLVGVPLALLSLYLGIILGDFWLYGMGYLAAHHSWARWFTRHARYESTRAWLEERFEGAVFTSRFVPGMRLPTYTAAGFLKLPFRRFVPPVILGTLVWTSLFFAGSYAFGNMTSGWLGLWRWPIIAAALVAWFAFNRSRLNRKAARDATRPAEGA